MSPSRSSTHQKVEEVLFHSHVVGRLEEKITSWTPPQIEEANSALGSLLSSMDHVKTDISTSRPPLLALGVLTMPVPARSPDLRTYHRAVHRAQPSVFEGQVALRYVVTNIEVARVVMRKHKEDFKQERERFQDIVELPTVPEGFGFSVAPDGANCVLKILSWMQYALKRFPQTTFIGYGDDDTFWALQRVERTLSTLHSVGADLLPVYLGAIQYHGWWDFVKHQSTGWFWSFPTALHHFASQWPAFRDDMLKLPPSAKVNPYVQNESAMIRQSHPYAMAHGLGVLLSSNLSQQMLVNTDIRTFLSLYQQHAGTRYSASPKCRLGTDSTFGLWVSYLPFVVAIDFRNFQGGWPWPLPKQCHGRDARHALRHVHAFHLFGNEARVPQWWMFLLNVTTDAAPPESNATYRMYCEGGRTADAKRLASQWAASPRIEIRRSSSFFEKPFKGIERVIRRYHDWLFCDVSCTNSDPCPHGWPGLLRRRS